MAEGQKTTISPQEATQLLQKMQESERVIPTAIPQQQAAATIPQQKTSSTAFKPGIKPEEAAQLLQKLQQSERTASFLNIDKDSTGQAQQMQPQATQPVQQPLDSHDRMLMQAANNMSPQNVASQTRKGLSPGVLIPKLLNSLNEMADSSRQTVADFGVGSANLALRGLTSLINTRLPEGQKIEPHQFKHPDFDSNVKSPVNKVIGSLLGLLFLSPATAPMEGAADIATGAKRAETVTSAALRRVLSSAAKGGAFGGIFGAAQPDSKIGQNVLGGAITGGAMGGALEGVNLPFARAREALSQEGSRFSSLDEIKKIQQILSEEKIKTSFGDIANSPGLRHFYHDILRSMPFTGVEGSEDTMVAKTHHLLDDFMSHLKGNRESSGVIDDLIKGISEHSKEQEQIKRELYNDVNEKSAQANLNLRGKFNNLQDYAKSILDEEKSNIENDLEPRLNKETKDVLGRAIKLNQEPGQLESSITDIEGKPLISEGDPSKKIVNFDDAIKNSSRYGELARKHANDDNQFLASVYKGLDSSIKKDISEGINNTGNDELENAWTAAKTHFKENVLPTREAAIIKLIDKGQGAETIHNQLATKKFENLLTSLRPDTRKLVGYRLFDSLPKNDKGGFAPSRVMSKYQKLEQSVKDRLFSPEEKEMIERHNALARIAGKNLLDREKPPTGFRLSSLLKGAGILAAGAKFPAATAAGFGAAPIVAKILRSPKLIDALRRGNLIPLSPLISEHLLPLIAGHAQSVKNQNKDVF
jgi:hypothetical protein